VIFIDLWDGGLLFLLENSDRARHRAKAVFLANICIDPDFKHIRSSCNWVVSVDN
jgi:hypothetical protein